MAVSFTIKVPVHVHYKLYDHQIIDGCSFSEHVMPPQVMKDITPGELAQIMFDLAMKKGRYVILDLGPDSEGVDAEETEHHTEEALEDSVYWDSPDDGESIYTSRGGYFAQAVDQWEDR